MANTTTTQTIEWSRGYIRVPAGAPLDTNGVIANNSTAIGIVAETVEQGGTATIITAGEWDMSIGYAAGITLSEECRRALSEIRFTDEEGATQYVRSNPIPEDGAVPAGDGYAYQAGEFPEIPEIPVAENVAESTATTVEALKDDFNALREALIEAGMMEEDPEPDPTE